MHLCPGCMREFEDQYRFCPYCGYTYDSPARQKAITQAMALNAEERIPTAEAFLYAQEYAQSQPSTPQRRVKSGRFAAWFLSAALVFAAVTAVVIFLLLRDDSPERSRKMAASTEVQTAIRLEEPTTRPSDPDAEIPVISATASSDQGSGKYGRNYHAENVIDGDFNTCWMAAGENAGRGAWIQLNFSGVRRVSGIKLLNGNCWDGYADGEKVESGLYDLNGRICDFTLEFSDGSTQSFTAADVREERFGANIFLLDRQVDTQYVRLTVDSGYPGSKWTTVVCLSEFAVF